MHTFKICISGTCTFLRFHLKVLNFEHAQHVERDELSLYDLAHLISRHIYDAYNTRRSKKNQTKRLSFDDNDKIIKWHHLLYPLMFRILVITLTSENEANI
jgi:hypothetical protein